MKVYVIRINGDDYLKTLRNIPIDLKESAIERLHIQTTMTVLDDDSVWCAKELKRTVKSLYDQTNYPPFLGLMNKINALDDDEYVTLFNFLPTSRFLHQCRIACEVKRIGGSPCEAWHPSLQDEKSGRYDVYAYLYHGSTQYIGEKDKDKRTCRFCHKTGAKRFIKEAHAISAFLGNDYLICNEECDKCNKDFSETIEQDVDNYFKVTRCLSRNLNRDKQTINAKGENFYIDNSEKYPMLTYYAKANEEIDIDDIGENGFDFYLLNNDSVKLSNIYKCFVKFAISVIPNEFIPRFRKTTDWINGKLDSNSLPPLYKCDSIIDIERPEIAVLIRKDDNKDVPFCVVRFAFLSCYYIFTVPYCQPYDTDNSTLEKALDRYLQLCNENKEMYNVENYNSSERKPYYTKVTIYKNSKLKVQLKDSFVCPCT